MNAVLKRIDHFRRNTVTKPAAKGTVPISVAASSSAAAAAASIISPSLRVSPRGPLAQPELVLTTHLRDCKCYVHMIDDESFLLIILPTYTGLLQHQPEGSARKVIEKTRTNVFLYLFSEPTRIGRKCLFATYALVSPCPCRYLLAPDARPPQQPRCCCCSSVCLGPVSLCFRLVRLYFLFYLIYLNNTNEPFRSAIGNKSSPPKSPRCRCPAASRRPTWKAQAQPARPEEAHSCQRPVDRAPVQGPPLFAARANATMNRTRRRTMTTTTTMANTTNH